MKTMKKAKAPSAKTLARKAKEAAMIAWGKGMRVQKMKEFEERKKREREKPVVSLAVQGYIDSMGTVRGKLGTPVRENTYIPPGVREKVAQATRTDSPTPTTPQPVSADYAGGGWYEHRSTRQILWMRGLRNQAELDRLGIPGNYLGNSATIGDGEYETFYLPDGKSFRRRAETLKPENYTFLKQWEDKAKVNDNILLTISFEMINGLYVLVRAMVGAQPKSISGRGLNPQEKLEAGMSGLTTVTSFIIPVSIPILKGTKQGMTFQEFSKAMKNSYKGQGYTRGQQLKIKWHDYKQNELHLELNSSNPKGDIEYIINITDKVINNKTEKP